MTDDQRGWLYGMENVDGMEWSEDGRIAGILIYGGIEERTEYDGPWSDGMLSFFIFLPFCFSLL